jgi:hypothetical protein
MSCWLAYLCVTSSPVSLRHEPVRMFVMRSICRCHGKARKAPISFVMSVRPSLCPYISSGPTRRIFVKFDIGGLQENRMILHMWLKSDTSIWQFALRPPPPPPLFFSFGIRSVYFDGCLFQNDGPYGSVFCFLPLCFDTHRFQIILLTF